VSDTGIRVNMSAQEGKSTTQGEPLPSGLFRMAITNCSLEKVKNPPQPGKKDNRGKPMFVIELTVQDGDYEDRPAWTNVMLFDGALYSISQMLKAQGVEVKEVGDAAEFQVPGFEKNEVPGPEWWLSKQFVCRLKRIGARKVGDKEYDPRAEVKGFLSVKDWNPDRSPKKAQQAAGMAKAKSSVLP